MSGNLIKSADQTVEKLAKIVDHPYSEGNFVFYDCGLATISADDIRELLAEYKALRTQLTPAREHADELVEALREAKYALGLCYDVCDYPANGETKQDDAIASIDLVLSRIKEAL